MNKVIIALMLVLGASVANAQYFDCYDEEECVKTRKKECSKDYWACEQLASKYFIAKDFKQAEVYYKKGCELKKNDPYYRDYPDLKCNAHTVVEYFTDVCYSDYREATTGTVCMQLGDMYYEGNKEMKVGRNTPLAKKYWAEALDKRTSLPDLHGSNINGWDNGFYEDILSYLKGKKADKEIKPDYTKAKLLAEIACERGGKWFLEEDGSLSVGDRAFEPIQAKPIGQACEILGDIYAQGKGVKQDLNKAKAFYQKACENPYITEGQARDGRNFCFGTGRQGYYASRIHFGCAKLGDMYYLENNHRTDKATRKLWAKAVSEHCSNEECQEERWNISSAYYQEAEGYYNGYIIKKEYEFDEEYNRIEKETYIKYEQDYDKALVLAVIGCGEFFEDFKSCSIIADAYTQGKGVKQDLNAAQFWLTRQKQYEAKEIYKKAKKLTTDIVEDKGEGVEPTTIGFFDFLKVTQAIKESEVIELLQKACSLDSKSPACTDLKEKNYEKQDSSFFSDLCNGGEYRYKVNY